jgi:very-short-patch-repair endonuclease
MPNVNTKETKTKTNIDITYVVAQNKLGRSTYDIAEELKTYPNKIRRILINEGEPVRTKSEAQKQALASGRHKHPTKGKQRPLSTKDKISEKMSSYWHHLTEEERASRVKMAQEQWALLSEIEKNDMRKAAAKAVRNAAKNGSKTEQFLLITLRSAGYEVEFHRENFVANERLQVDLFLPTEGVAIEIDGPAHFFPIWGQDSLDKHIKADAQKTGLLLDRGYTLIRVKHLAKSISEKYKREIAKRIVAALESIKGKQLSREERLIEIEVV